MTDPVQPKTRRKPGPKPVKGDLAVLALKREYQQRTPEVRAVIRQVVLAGPHGSLIAEVAKMAYELDEAGVRDAIDLFDVIDNRRAAKE